MARSFKTLKELRFRKQINSMFLDDITQSEISNIFESLKTKFSLDTYGLNLYYLKKVCPVLLPVLTKFFQKCFIDKSFRTVSKLPKLNLSLKKAMI